MAIRDWTEQELLDTCNRLLCGQEHPWPEDQTGWHATRLSNKLRKHDDVSHEVYDAAYAACNQVIRSLDRKYTGHSIRDEFSECAADCVMMVPVTPSLGVRTFQKTIPEVLQQACVAAAWAASSKLKEIKARPEPKPEPKLFAEAA